MTPLGRILVLPCGLVGIPLVLGSLAWVGQLTLHIIEHGLKLFK